MGYTETIRRKWEEGAPIKTLQFYPAGDSALVVEFGQTIDEAINDQVHAMAGWVAQQRIRGVLEVLPTFRSLMIYYDPLRISYNKLVKRIGACPDFSDARSMVEKKILEVPCCYDGPDLDSMEQLTGLPTDKIIEIHSGVDYKIYMMGFLPGFVYLGGLDPRICAPRLETPRTRIEPGSVGIGGSQTGVYPVASPGGWRILGYTPLKFYDPSREDPILCKAGEYIRFIPISRAEYERLVVR